MSEAAATLAPTAPILIGRYALFDQLAAGGMATVHLGRLLEPGGLGRTVAVKRLHAHYLKDQEFIAMFLDEAHIVARIRHPNVVPMAEVVQSDKGLFLIMEYIHGESLSRLMRTARTTGEQIPPRIVASVMCGVLHGLHAAHETRTAEGTLLGVVHRDVSPQNIIVGADGAARVLDFGIAKAAGRAQVTREGQIKGKLAYMAPEQIRGHVDRRSDVFAASVVLWEMLAGRRLHEGSKDVDIVTRVVKGHFAAPSLLVPGLSSELDAVVLRGLAVDPNKRFASARELALGLEGAVGLASAADVSAWVEHLAKDVLTARGSLVSAMELAASDLVADESLEGEKLRRAAGTSPAAAESVGASPSSESDEGPALVHRDGDVPSLSAVFPNSAAPRAPSPRPLRPGSRKRIAWFALAISAMMAVASVSLATYAVKHRRSRTRPSVAQSAGLPALDAQSAGLPALDAQSRHHATVGSDSFSC